MDTPSEVLPEHMSVADRNMRLYETLKGYGLFITPVCSEKDPTVIDQMVVSCAMPTVDLGVCACQKASSSDISPPVKRSDVGEGVTPPIRNADNVVDFPSVL